MMFPHMVEEKVCGPGSRDRSDSGNEMPYFVTESTTTIMELCPADCGSSTMKSMLIVSHEADGIGRGWSSPVRGCRNDLV